MKPGTGVSAAHSIRGCAFGGFDNVARWTCWYGTSTSSLIAPQRRCVAFAPFPLRRLAPAKGASRSDSGRAFHPGILGCPALCAVSCARSGASSCEAGEAVRWPRSCHMAAPERLRISCEMETALNPAWWSDLRAGR